MEQFLRNFAKCLKTDTGAILGEPEGPFGRFDGSKMFWQVDFMP